MLAVAFLFGAATTYAQSPADKCWDGGKVYKPTNGKTYKVEVSFDDAKTLRVKGSLGPISLSRYWKKIE